MEIRRFSASDTRSAMRLIRSEMGADAVILSTRPTADGVELISARDYDAELLDGLSESQSRGSEDVAVDDINKDERHSTVDIGIQRELTDTVRDLKLLLNREAQRVQPTPHVKRSPAAAACASQLESLGYTDGAVRRLLGALPKRHGFQLDESQFESLLTKTVGVRPLPIADEPTTLAVVGPTGVGKTTTIAKLAVRLALRYSTDDIALVSTDASRLGAHVQLASLGRLLAIPVFEIDNVNDLAALLPSLATRRWVLIDTAGTGDTVARTAQLRRTVEQGHRKLDVLLAVAANAHPTFIAQTLVAHHSGGASSLTLTKLDEAPTIAPAVSVLIEHAKALSVVTTGPSIPDDLVHGPEALQLLAQSGLRHRGQPLLNEFTTTIEQGDRP
ncbi:MAG: flagellar biosynthesis protein FlhF [Pseudomonadota bacterium]